MFDLTRRQFLHSAGLAAAALAVSPLSLLARGARAAFTLPPLPYAHDALEPYIDAMTMEIHHDRHHKAYVDNLNKALADHPDLQGKDVNELLRDLPSLPEKVRTAVRNNGGGHSNHSIFWLMMKKGGGGKPDGELAKAIDEAFGGFDKFQEAFSTAATTRFGSGWAWLISDQGKLKVTSTANQDTPIMEKKEPLLGIDVWEHAYYLKYQNRRADYVKNWWNVVNWDYVAERFKNAAKG
jgi:Fe-Mn family superoxide dismutase